MVLLLYTLILKWHQSHFTIGGKLLNGHHLELEMLLGLLTGSWDSQTLKVI